MEELKKSLALQNIKDAEDDEKIMKEVVAKHENVRERAVGYIYQLITVNGIVAGFGFTAVSSVINKNAFIGGEFLFFSAIAVSIWFTKKAFIDEAREYADYIQDLDKIMERRLNIKFESSIDVIEDELRSIRSSELVLFRDHKNNINSDLFFRIILGLFICGVFLLLFSFLS